GELNTKFNDYLNRYTQVIKINKGENRAFEKLSSFGYVIAEVSGTISEEDIAWLKKLDSSTHLILTVFDRQEFLLRFKEFKNVICAHRPTESQADAVSQIIFGGMGATGRLTEINFLNTGLHQGIFTQPLGRFSYGKPEEAGMESKTLEDIDAIVAEAIREQATPGCQVLIARHGKIIFDKSYGFYTYDSLQPVTSSTIYDLASVTKVLSTLQSVMFMEERGLIDVEKRLSAYLPELRNTNKEELNLKNILLHQAGLRPYMPFYIYTMEDEQLKPGFYSEYQVENYPLQVSLGLYAKQDIRDSVWTWIIKSRLLKKKSWEKYSYRYSDVGFYMMQRLAEKVLNQPLNEFTQQNFYDPLGMTTTGYLPLCRFSSDLIAPTAEDSRFRKQLVNGIVHDEGAAMFGGVAGHAGLFSNANDLAKLLQMLLNGGTYAGQKYFNKETIEKFTQKQVEENRRGLGWDKPTVGSWKGPTSESASALTFGHTGFTGTAVWVDPEFDLVYIFLSNRIHPDAENTKLMKLNTRTRIQDAIYKSIWNIEQYKEQ
ncbi:MAG: serine hydrolase, partial [Cyclobacteriaceae bacterium]|nr:serine hydrolase [Cyclobacteriaceae bacterium]